MKKFNLKNATFGGISGLIAPFLIFFLIVGFVMWDWNLLFENLLKEPFFARVSIIFCIIGFLIGGFSNENKNRT